MFTTTLFTIAKIWKEYKCSSTDELAKKMWCIYVFHSVQSLSHVRFFVTHGLHSIPDFPVHYQLPELAQTHVHRVGDAIQSSHTLSSPSPLAFNISQHQGLFQ